MTRQRNAGKQRLQYAQGTSVQQHGLRKNTTEYEKCKEALRLKHGNRTEKGSNMLGRNVTIPSVTHSTIVRVSSSTCLPLKSTSKCFPHGTARDLEPVQRGLRGRIAPDETKHIVGEKNEKCRRGISGTHTHTERGYRIAHRRRQIMDTRTLLHRLPEHAFSASSV